MAITAIAQQAANLLINYVTQEIQTIEPVLQFARFGVQRDIPKGWNKLTFPQTNQIATSSVSTITEGTNPTSTTWGTTDYTVAQTEYGLVVQITDILLRNSAIELLEAAVRQVKFALARQIDNSIQTTLQGSGGKVEYAGGKSARANLAAGDLTDVSLVVKGQRDLLTFNNGGVRPFDGTYYVLICSPNVATDLMLNTSMGGWVDLARYNAVDELKLGKMGTFRGFRMLMTANLQTISSTVTVHPSYLIGEEAYGWGYFLEPQPIITTISDSNNPLNLYTTIGAKASLGSVLFENNRLVRLESAVSA